MSQVEIEREKTCAVTGHRILQKDFDREKVKSTLEGLVESGFNTFLVGMALGFDTECFLILEEIRKKKNIKIIACIPCESQAAKFNYEQKKLYAKMLDSADEKVFVSVEYTPYCMMKRNMFMVDNCSCLISYLRENTGGTKKTVDYANRQNIKVISL